MHQVTAVSELPLSTGVVLEILHKEFEICKHKKILNVFIIFK
jgi:hypothetical protein